MRMNSNRRGTALQAQLAAAVVIAAVSGTLVLQGQGAPVEIDPITQRAWVDAMALGGLGTALDDLARGGPGAIDRYAGMSSGWTSQVADFGGALQVKVTARDGDLRSTAEAIVERVPLNVAGALTLATEFPRVEGLGETVRLVGTDSDWDGAPANGAALAQLASPRGIGAPGISATATGALDLSELADRYRLVAENREAGGQKVAAWGNIEFDHFALTHVSGDLTLIDSSAGAGLLVVDGNLRIRDVLTWHGAILVTGSVIIEAGASAYCYGAMMVGGEVRQAARSSAEAPGTLDIEYSSRAMSAIANMVTYEVVETVRPR